MDLGRHICAARHRAIAAFVLLLVASLSAPSYAIARGSLSLEGFFAIVVGDVCNLRAGPDTTYPTVGSVSAGEILEIVSYEDNWAKVRLGASTAYIAGWLVDVDLASQSIMAQIDATDVNVREGPGLDFKVRTMTTKGASFPALAKRGAWVKVDLDGKGTTGWISEGLLTLGSAGSLTPEPATPVTPSVPSGLCVVPAKDTLRIFMNANTGSEVLARLAQGESAAVTGAQGAWLTVETVSGLRGWVYGPDARICSLADSSMRFLVSEGVWTIGKYRTTTVTATDVNFRGGPGTSYPIVGSLDRGDVLQVIKQEGDWVQGISPQGITGWVAGWLVGPIEPEPVDAFAVSLRNDGNGRTLVVTGPFENSVVVTGGDGAAVIVSTSSFFGASALLPVNSYEFASIQVDGSDVTAFLEGAGNYQVVSKAPGRVELSFTPKVTSVLVKTNGTTDILTINTLGYAAAEITRDGDTVSFFLPGASMFDEIPSCQGQSVLGATAKARDGGVDVAVRLRDNLPYQIKHTANTIEATFGGGGLSGTRIVIDPGHEAEDPGAVGPSGLAERNANWEVAVRLVDLLKQAGADAILTRQTMYGTTSPPKGWVPDPATYSGSLSERAAWSQGADLFVSIHNDWNYDRSVGGTAVYVCTKNPNSSESQRFASLALAELTRALGTKNRGVKSSGLYVVREAKCPSVLIEMMFISNPVEESYLRRQETWEKAADALCRAIARYFGASLPSST